VSDRKAEAAYHGGPLPQRYPGEALNRWNDDIALIELGSMERLYQGDEVEPESVPVKPPVKHLTLVVIGVILAIWATVILALVILSSNAEPPGA